MIRQVDVRLSTEALPSDLAAFDSVVLATGVLPRDVKIPQTGSGKVNVISYIDALKGENLVVD